MYVHLISVDSQLCFAIEEGFVSPQKFVDGVSIKKLLKEWNDDETKKASYDLKARNIRIFSLSVNVYFQYHIVNIRL